MCLLLPCIENANYSPRNCLNEKGFIQKYCDELQYIHDKCQKFPAKKYWRLTIIRLLTSLSFYMFFAHYSPLLKSRFEITFHMKGYVMAYQHFVLFACNNLAMFFVKNHMNEENIHMGLIVTLVWQTIVMTLMYNVASFGMYLVLFVPMAFLRMFFENIWNHLCSGNEDVKQPIRFIIRFMDIILPIILSTALLDFELDAIIIDFVLVPLVIATTLSLNYYY